MRLSRITFAVLLLALCVAFSNGQDKSNISINTYLNANETFPVSITMNNEKLSAIVDSNARYAVLGKGYKWTEGPLWIDSLQWLLFSDVPANTIYKWSAESGMSTYLKPSGYTGNVPRGGEPGANGILLDKEGNLVLCQHGDRRIARMDVGLEAPRPSFVPIADAYQNKKLNSPNDIVQADDGTYYFTDPPYGLNDQHISQKELEINGVYRVDLNGNLTLLVDSLTRPNGVALMPDQKRLIVSNSDSKKSALYCFYLNGDGTVKKSSKVFDFTPYLKDGKGVSDGLTIDSKGNIFASGPQGIWIFDSEFTVLGRLGFDHSISNCFITADGKALFITGSDRVLLLRMYHTL